MTKLMEEAIAAVKKLPAEQQDELAQLMIDASSTDVYELSEAEHAAVARGLADIAAGRFASDEEVDVTFSRLRTA